MDVYGYRNGSASIADRILREAYERTCEFVMEGGTLPVAPSGLIDHVKDQPKPADPAVAKAHMDKIAELLKTEPVKPYSEVDHVDAA